MKDDKLFKNIIVIVVVTLAVICLGVVAVMLQALFVPDVDNEKIFSIIGPAFNTVIGAFVGLLGGLSINKSNECKDRN
jgi:hypothetical protein